MKGLPPDTTLIARWNSTASLPNGDLYRNPGVHIVRMRWGQDVDPDAHEDAQAVAAWLDRLCVFGIIEAKAPPIVS